MIYLLHLDQPLSPNHTAQHYLGYCEFNLARRVRQHARGQGSRFMEVAAERGIGFKVTRVWEGERADERKLKNRKEAPQFCPICHPSPINPRLQELDIKDAMYKTYEYKETRCPSIEN